MTKSADAYDSANFICLHLRSKGGWEALISQKLALSPSNLNPSLHPHHVVRMHGMSEITNPITWEIIIVLDVERRKTQTMRACSVSGLN